MNNQDTIINALKVERECAYRRSDGRCDHECAECDLCVDNALVLKAYDAAINQFQREKNHAMIVNLFFFIFAMVPCLAFIASMVFFVIREHYVFASLSFIIALLTAPSYSSKH